MCSINCWNLFILHVKDGLYFYTLIIGLYIYSLFRTKRALHMEYNKAKMNSTLTIYI